MDRFLFSNWEVPVGMGEHPWGDRTCPSAVLFWFLNSLPLLFYFDFWRLIAHPRARGVNYNTNYQLWPLMGPHQLLQWSHNQLHSPRNSSLLLLTSAFSPLWSADQLQLIRGTILKLVIFFCLALISIILIYIYILLSLCSACLDVRLFEFVRLIWFLWSLNLLCWCAGPEAPAVFNCVRDNLRLETIEVFQILCNYNRW